MLRNYTETLLNILKGNKNAFGPLNVLCWLHEPVPKMYQSFYKEEKKNKRKRSKNLVACVLLTE